MDMEQGKRNYMLLVGYGRPEESEYRKRAGNFEESFRQFSLRTKAGVPLVSEHEETYRREVEAQRERRLGLFWESFPLIMRNWKTVLRYRILADIPLDSLGLVYAVKGVTLGSLVFAWRARSMRSVCPKCGGTAYFLPYIEDFFGGPWCRTDDFPEKSHVYCSDCLTDARYYDFDYDPEAACHHFRYRLERWMRSHRPAESEMIFERAMHLLKLCEVYGEPPEEILFV